MIQNSSAICKNIQEILDYASVMFQHKAYLHSYIRYGGNEIVYKIKTGIADLENIVLDYKQTHVNSN